MNLVEAILQAAEKVSNPAHNSYDVFQKYLSYPRKFQAIINEFFEVFYGYSFSDLVDWCGGKIPKPLTQSVHVEVSLEDIKKLRPYLSDEQAANILDKIYLESLTDNASTFDRLADLQGNIEALIDTTYPIENFLES